MKELTLKNLIPLSAILQNSQCEDRNLNFAKCEKTGDLVARHESKLFTNIRIDSDLILNLTSKADGEEFCNKLKAKTFTDALLEVEYKIQDITTKIEIFIIGSE